MANVVSGFSYFGRASQFTSEKPWKLGFVTNRLYISIASERFNDVEELERLESHTTSIVFVLLRIYSYMYEGLT